MVQKPVAGAAVIGMAVSSGYRRRRLPSQMSQSASNHALEHCATGMGVAAIMCYKNRCLEFSPPYNYGPLSHQETWGGGVSMSQTGRLLPETYHESFSQDIPTDQDTKWERVLSFSHIHAHTSLPTTSGREQCLSLGLKNQS